METENKNDDDMQLEDINLSKSEKKEEENSTAEKKEEVEVEKKDEENKEIEKKDVENLENNTEKNEENISEKKEEENNENIKKEEENDENIKKEEEENLDNKDLNENNEKKISEIIQRENLNFQNDVFEKENNNRINNEELSSEQNFIQNDVKKTLDETLKDIQNEIYQKNQNIEDIDNKLGELSLNPTTNKTNIFNRFSNEDKMKKLNKLQNKSSRLQSNINALNKAQLKYENESFMSIPTETAEIMHREKLKKIKNEKSILMSKLNDINSQINAIVDKENRNQSKKTLIKNFLDNFESDKEKFSGAMMALSKEVSQRRKERNEERKRKEEENERKYLENLNMKEREKELIKEEFKNRQKTLEKRIKEKNSRIMEYSKKFIHGAPSLKDKNYITAEEREMIRKEEENQLLNLQLAKRKEYFKPISAKELNEFSREVQNNEKRTMAELEQKKIQLEQLYKERKELLPKYHSQFYKINYENEMEFLNRENVRIEKINQQKKRRKKFDEEVRKLYFPTKIDEKLKKQRENIISTLKGENRIEDIKNLNKQIQKAAHKYKVPPVKIAVSQDLKKTSNSTNTPETEEKKEEEKEKIVDYLAEMRKKREKKNQNLSNSVDNKEQWEKMLSNNKNQRNLYDNIFDVQVQAEKLQKEAEFKTKLYKLDPVKNSNKREEITNLYIDSIQAKLQILKKINERSEDEED